MTRITDDYHSALCIVSNLRAPESNLFIGKRGHAFVHDICDGIPDEMLRADVLYGELPWGHGYNVYAKRIGIEQTKDYKKMLFTLAESIEKTRLPACFITGIKTVKSLNPWVFCDATINEGDAVACLWKLDPWQGTKDSIEILESLADRYNCVADPFCGYGRSGRIFVQCGKRYIMSDFDPHCIGYIAEHEREWIEDLPKR